MLHNFVGEVKKHPYLFGGVAIAVLVFFLWPSSSSSGTGTSAISAEESEAIAQAAASNTDLQVAADSVTMNGQNTAAAEAISNAMYASQNYIAATAAGVSANNNRTQVQLAGVAAGAQSDQDNAILASQSSAESYEEYMEDYHGILPGGISTAGFTNSSPNTGWIAGPVPSAASLALQQAYKAAGLTLPGQEGGATVATTTNNGAAAADLGTA